MLPWNLFQLTERDRTGLLIRDFKQVQDVGGAAASFFEDVVVPADNCLLIHGFGAQGTASAGQTPQAFAIEITSPGASTPEFQARFDFLSSVTPATSKADFRPLFLLAGPNHLIRMYIFFNAGALVNGGTLTLAGILIPKGTIGYS